MHEPASTPALSTGDGVNGGLTQLGGTSRAIARPSSAEPSFAGEAAPLVPQGHLFATEEGTHLLLTNGSRVYGLEAQATAAFEQAVRAGDAEAVDRLLITYGLEAQPYVEDEAPASFPIRALSLAVAQKCNLGCTYCYAEGGDFGAPARNMDMETAAAAVDRLFEDVAPGEGVNLAFMGGEPLVNRQVLVDATELAALEAQRRKIRIGFSITTNGTLLTPEDGAFFERHGFAVTISLDGIGNVHDRQRAFKGGQGSYERIVERTQPLLAMQRRMQVSARVTVTPHNLRLRETLDGLIELGFHSVGFSPMLTSPTGGDELEGGDLADMLEQMIGCGREFERRLITGERYPFSNLVNALREIHKGTHRPYPCGAGAGYFGVSADGELAACHRFVGDANGAHGHPHRRRRGSQAGGLAARPPRPHSGAVQKLLGTLSLRWWLPS